MSPVPTSTPPALHEPVRPWPGRLARAPQSLLLALVAAGAAVLAAGLAWGIDRGLGGSAWAAPLGALLGVALAAWPAAWALRRMATFAQAPVRAAVLPPAHGVAHGGVPRPLFLALAGREWARARRYGSGAALLLVDADGGNPAAGARDSEATGARLDELLRQTAPTLRGADLLTRFADSQLAVFLAPSDATGALDVAERIRERAEQLEGLPLSNGHPGSARFTVSVGVAQLRPAHLNLQSLIDDAHDAVLAAHQVGGNCVRAAPVDLGRRSPADGWRSEPRARR
jgi:diguanylate cyclase (GGDEF)-like protein